VRARAGRRRPRFVTLASDLGAAYAAQMKAVLARSVPPSHVIDLVHDLRPHAIPEAAFVLRAAVERFPSGFVHVVVVDPGVGGARQPIVLACGDGTLLVGPDNGVLPPLAEARGGGVAYRIRPERLGALRRVGTTFDGRDVFAPAAALLALGVPPERLGPRASARRLPTRGPRHGPSGATGTVVHVDRFGNLVTDVPTGWVPRPARTVTVRTGRTRRTVPFVTSYEEAGAGRLLALGSSFGTVEVAVAQGRAADRLGTLVGSRVALGWARARRKGARSKVSKQPPR
jgi:S-adenosyl-L-methionine hydrolase (adenosine-forming)